MYNRYIPQSDGSYRRNRVQDNSPEQAPPVQPQSQQTHHSEPVHQNHPPRQDNVGSFLKKLLPKEFDTGDLLVVLLLLLMAEHCEEDKNTALLTLALYFFM